MESWELIIIGAGPAGLTAGLYGVRSGLKVLIIEEKIAGGKVSVSPWIENYPGFPEGISGAELSAKMLDQCRRFGIEIKELEHVKELQLEGSKKIVRTDRKEYSAEAVIIASGSQNKILGIPGELEFVGKGVSYCAICDGAFFKQKKILVVGGGNTAAMSALYLANIASEVIIMHRRDQMRAEEVYIKELADKNVQYLWNTELLEIKGDLKVKSAVLFENKSKIKKEIPVDGVFVFIGEIPNSQIAQKAGIIADEKGYIITDALQKTNIPGIYAVGDVTKCPVKQIGTAIGQAIIAATDVFRFIKKPSYVSR